MGVLTALPVLAFDFLKVQQFSVDVVGGAIEGGRNALGQTVSMDMSGGGVVTCTLSNLFIQSSEQHEYINYLAAMLNGSYNNICVPLKTDWMGPFPLINGVPTPIISGIPHSDGSLFSDGSGYSQGTVYGQVTDDADGFAGVLDLKVFGASRRLRWSDWVSILHPNMGWRLYRYWKVLSDDGAPDGSYSVVIKPTLREAVTVGTRVEFARPLGTFKFAPGFTLPWTAQGFWRSSPTLQFVEAF